MYSVDYASVQKQYILFCTKQLFYTKGRGVIEVWNGKKPWSRFQYHSPYVIKTVGISPSLTVLFFAKQWKSDNGLLWLTLPRKLLSLKDLQRICGQGGKRK